jgi:hypothetical protein
MKEYASKMEEVTNNPEYVKALQKTTSDKFSKEELNYAFSRVKLGTAAGPSGIPPEYYRLHGVQAALRIIFNAILDLQVIPDCWRTTYKWCVTKDKDLPMGLHNARPISLLEIEFKIFESPERFAMETVYKWHRFPPALSNLLNNMDKDIISSILTPGNGMTDPFKIERGCPQGSVISPLKWDLFLNPVLHVITSNNKGYKFHNSEHAISCTCFADNTALLAPDRDSLIKMFRTFASYCGMNGVSINAKKTVVIIIIVL